MAAAGVAPIACSRRGKWDAMAADTNQVAANTPARTIMVQEIAPPSPCAEGGGGSGGGACGTSNRFIGKPTRMCSAAQPRQAPRQPNASIMNALRGHPTVLAKPA